MKLRLVFVVAVLLLVGVVTLASAQGDPESFTGCLTQGGTLVRVAIGEEPAEPCSALQTEVSWNRQGPPGPPGGDERPSLYYHLCNEILLPGQAPVNVMTLEVPAGSWLAHISIQSAPLGPCGWGDPRQGTGYDGWYHCTLLTPEETGGHPASSHVDEALTLAWSQPFSLEQQTTVAVSCWLGGGEGATLSVGDLAITPIHSFVSP